MVSLDKACLSYVQIADVHAIHSRLGIWTSQIRSAMDSLGFYTRRELLDGQHA